MGNLSAVIGPEMHSLRDWVTKAYASKYFPWLLIAAGVILRVKQYLHNTSLWLDEAALALNLINRSLSGLFQPLDYDQAAPAGFLILEKMALEIGGNSEYALRFFPLVAGIASLFLFYLLAGRYVHRTAMPLAVGLFAVSEYLVFYSAELKQYSSDVAVTLLLLLLADNVLSRAKYTPNMLILGAVGAVAIWFSHPALFVLAGIGIALGVTFLARRETRHLIGIAIVGCLWLISAALNYLLSLRFALANSRLEQYWRQYFAPIPPLSFSDFKWFYDRFFEVFETPLDFRIPGIAAFAFIVGCWMMFRKNRTLNSLLLSPILVALLASSFHLFPFYGRLLLFLSPIILLFVAEGTAEIVRASRFASPAVGIVFVALLVIYPLRSGVYALIRPFYRAEIKPIMQCIKGEHQRRDPIYVHYGATRAFEYYLGKYELSDSHYILGASQTEQPEKYIAEIDGLRGKQRVWFVFSLPGDYSARQMAELTAYLDQIGERLKTCRSPGAAAYLYDLRPDS